MDARIDERQTKKERIKDVRYQESPVTLDCAQEAAVKGHLFFCSISRGTRQCRVFLFLFKRYFKLHPGVKLVAVVIELTAHAVCSRGGHIVV